MDLLPIYSLDIETRLNIDQTFYDSEDYNKKTFEGIAFKYFSQKLNEELKIWEEKSKKEQNNDDKHSLELLLLNRDITVLMNVIDHYEEQINNIESLNDEEYEDALKIYNYIYDMTLRYRYTLGLYDADETFYSYQQRKIGNFKKDYFMISDDYDLPTLSIPLDQFKDESKTNYVDILLEASATMAKKDEYFDFAHHQILNELYKIDLPTKYDWTPSSSGWRFSYLEQRAIQAEIIMHLKNSLRDAYVNDFDWQIKGYIAALNIIYYVNLKVSDIEVEKRPSELPDLDYIDASYITTGILGKSMYDASSQYAENIRMLGTRGHGIAAERANDLIDRALGKDAILLGDDNAKNGADRLVNGEAIQTKYCSTGGKAISECFENGKFRYVVDGKPMQIEVPKDKYDQALQSMKERIKRGDLKDLGITDPNQAEKIVRKGNVSYKTAQRIAKAGTIEGITYDTANGMVTGLQTFGISATLSFATSIWRGEDADEALENALKDGSKIFGRHIMQHVLTQQVGRTAIEKSLRPATDYVVKNVLGSKTSAQIVNTFFRTASQRSIHGAAAMNNLSKLMRGNIVTMAITTAVLSAGSIYDVINGRISGAQLFKNIGTTGGGVGGAALGATLGSVVPVVGTFVGGIIGGIVGGKVSKKALDAVIDDDSLATMETLKRVFVENIEELNLDRDELNYIAGKVFDQKTLPKELKLIYAASDSTEYISNKMDPYINAILKTRPKIKDMGNLLENFQESVENN